MDLAQYIWPKDRPDVKRRVVGAVALLVAGKARRHRRARVGARHTSAHSARRACVRTGCTRTRAPGVQHPNPGLLPRRRRRSRCRPNDAGPDAHDGRGLGSDRLYGRPRARTHAPAEVLTAAGDSASRGRTFAWAAGGTTALDGVARVGSSAFSELRNAVFSTVSQRAIRVMANNIFLHLHNLDLAFHLSKQTGALARALDRGNKGVSYFLTSIVFNIVPTIFEVGLVAAILGHQFGPVYAGVTFATVGAYTAFTFGITSWRCERWQCPTSTAAFRRR